MLDDMLARANSVCLPALPCSDWRVLALLLVARVYCAVLFCAVLAVLAVLAVRTMVLISRYLFDDARRQHARIDVVVRGTYVRKEGPTKKKNMRQEGSSCQAEQSMKRKAKIRLFPASN